MNCTSSKNTMNSSDAKNASSATEVAPLQETHWKLTELNNKPIPDTATNKEMYMILKNADSRVEGNGGCNAFSGTFKLEKSNKIFFGQMVSTKMWCQGLDYETRFFKTLSIADHYYIKGDTLSLTKGKLMRVAKFEAVK